MQSYGGEEQRFRVNPCCQQGLAAQRCSLGPDSASALGIIREGRERALCFVEVSATDVGFDPVGAEADRTRLSKLELFRERSCAREQACRLVESLATEFEERERGWDDDLEGASATLSLTIELNR